MSWPFDNDVLVMLVAAVPPTLAFLCLVFDSLMQRRAKGRIKAQFREHRRRRAHCRHSDATHHRSYRIHEHRSDGEQSDRRRAA